MQRDDSEIAELTQSIEETRSELRLTRLQMERYQEQHQSHVRRTRMLWAVAIVLMLSLAGLSWFAYPIVKNHPTFSDPSSGPQGGASTAGGRMDYEEFMINSWTAEITEAMNDRTAQLQEKMNASFDTARTYAQTVANQAGQRIRDEASQSLQAVRTRLSGLESNHREAHERVALLQNEVERLRLQLARLQGSREHAAAEAVQQRPQLPRAQQAADNDLSNSDRTTPDVSINRVGRERIDFEISNNRTEQVAPGIYLTVRRSDVGQQQVDGWVQIAADGHILRFSGQRVQNPMAFRTRQEARAHELIFTYVGRSSVAGYLLVPAPLTSSS